MEFTQTGFGPSGVPERSDDGKYIIDGEVWYALKQENWVPDREQWVIDSWNETFPERKLTSFEKIMSLTSRSKTLGNWYADVMDKYRDQVAVPIHVQDILGNEDYVKVSAEIAAHNAAVKELSLANERASREYKRVLKENEIKFGYIEERRAKSPLLFILTLTTEDMPLGVLDRVDEYVPKDDYDPISSRVYAREQLLRYQRYLVQQMNAGEDVFKIVEDQKMKFVNPI